MSVSSDQRMKGQGNHGNNGDYNSWGGSVNQGGSQYHSRKGGHGYDDYNNYNNSNRGAYGINDGGVKHVERGMQGLGLGGGHHDRNVPNSSHGGGGGGSGQQQQQQQQKDAPRKMTWASIASQPAKPTVTATSTISKKKGPGMPPPPMVPGRHNMDIGNWDSPSKNGPPLVPPTFNSEPQQSVPPVSASFADDPPPLSHNRQQANGGSGGGNGASGPAWPTPGQAMTAQHPPQSQVLPMQQQQQQQQQETQRRPERPHMSHYNHHHESAGGGMMNQNSDGGFRRGGPPHPMQPPSHQHHSNNYMPQQPNYSHSSAAVPAAPPQASQPQQPAEDTTEALNRLLDMSKYNPTNYEIENVDLARFFVIKSYSEDDIHRSIKYNIWCSTEHGNKRLDQAFHEREKEGGAVYLFYSVNGSGHFCGMAQMISPVDYSSNSSVWAQDKWKGSFKVRWVYVKDVPNANLRHIRLENNENKPVTNSRDTQEVPNAKGQQVWRIIQSYTHSTSLFDDFVHYEQRQQEESTRRVEPGPSPQSSYRTGSPQMFDNKYNNQQQDRSGDRGGRYGEQNNNPRDMGPASGPYDRGYQSSDTKYSSGYNNRNNYGNSTFDRGSYSRGNSGGYNNREYGYRRDDQGSRGGDGENGPPSGGYHSRGGGGNYRNNRGGFNNDYYNSRRQDNRDRGERGGYRPQGNSIDYANE